MNSSFRTILVLGFLFAIVCTTAVRGFAQSRPTQADGAIAEETANDQDKTGIVIIDGRQILSVYHAIGSYSPQDRADHIAERIIAVARSRVPPENIRLQARAGWTEILAEDQLLMAITDADAKAAKRPIAQLAAEDAGNIRQAIINYRREHTWGFVLRGTLYTLLTTAILVPLAWSLRKARLAIASRIERWIEKQTKVENKSGIQIVITYLSSFVLALGTFLRWIIILALIEAYLTICLSFFTSTRYISHAVRDWVFASLVTIGNSALNYLPNLLLIAVVSLITAQALRLINMFFGEIERGTLSFRGFYSDWAAPTAKLVRILIVVMVLIVIFPYLPGAKSPAFQGISIFLGVLLSLGSSSAVSNAVAGIIMTYMRSFLVGDWVKIGDLTGEVVEKNMLVTRLLTPKRETITIPNGSVMAGSVTNYTVEARKTIFHTTVTIGYEAPWRTVHELLFEAARSTKDILHDPRPFILQTALNDFYVSYELNAYTDQPLLLQFIYSDLHQNIQDKFNEAGLEICSPHFSSLRDGNSIAIPNRYIPPSYEPPAFRVNNHQEHEDAKRAAKGS